MRELPIVFPISLAIIVLMLVFTSAYAISANTVSNEQIYGAPLASVGVSDGGERASDRAWFQKAAFIVCPLH